MSLCDDCSASKNWRGACGPRIGLRIVHDKGKTVECNYYDYLQSLESTANVEEK